MTCKFSCKSGLEFCNQIAQSIERRQRIRTSAFRQRQNDGVANGHRHGQCLKAVGHAGTGAESSTSGFGVSDGPIVPEITTVFAFASAATCISRS